MGDVSYLVIWHWVHSEILAEVGLQRGIQIGAGEDQADTRSGSDFVMVSQLVQESVRESGIQRSYAGMFELSRFWLSVRDVSFCRTGSGALLGRASSWSGLRAHSFIV